MPEQSVIHSTFVIERSYSKSPEQVFAAFSEATKKRRWFAPPENPAEVFEMDFRVGGKERFVYRMGEATPFPGTRITNEGVYEDIVPDQRIVIAYRMSLGEKRITASLVTVEFLLNGDGTELICTHQGAYFEGSDGPERREDGWKTLFDYLAAELARA